MSYKLETQEDLFELLRKLPEKERFMAADIIMRLQDEKISIDKALAEMKQLFLESGLAIEKIEM